MKRKLLALWHSGERWFDAREMRERGLLALGAGAVVLGTWTVLAFDPAQAERRSLAAERETLELERSELALRQGEVLARHQNDPNTALRARQEQLAAQIARSDDEIRAYTAGMIGPRDMAELLEAMLRESNDLEFVRLVHEGPRALRPEGFEGDEATETGLFVHSMELVFRGSYLAALETLRALEALEGQFFWEGVEYESDDYPDGTATLRTFTLSSEEDWIGA